MSLRRCRVKMKRGTRHQVPLKTYVRLTVMCVRLCRQSLDNLARRKGEYESVMQVLEEVGARLTWGGMTFCPSDYRANQSQNLHQGTRQVLRQDPATRTQADINGLLVALRNIPAFAEYPKKMQRKLCQVGHFEAYESRRVILREGDPPTNFYFILSGAVLVTAFEDSTGTSRTLVSLTKGMSFGELAVISNTKRQATVCTKTDVELLSISGHEFEEIFMAGGRNLMGNQKQADFIRSVRFLQHWPVQELKGNSENCSVYYFDRNQVVVRDSNNSDWIYIVLKGSLSVIKKLKRVEAHRSGTRPTKKHRDFPSRQRPFNGNSYKERVLSHHTFYRHAQWNSGRNESTDYIMSNGPDRQNSWESPTFPLPGIKDTHPVYFRNVMELEDRLEQTLPGYHNSVERLGCLDYDSIIKEHKQRLLQKSPVLPARRVTRGNMATLPTHSLPNDLNHHNDHPGPPISGSALDHRQPRQRRRKTGRVYMENPHRTSFLPDIANHSRVVQQRNCLENDPADFSGWDGRHIKNGGSPDDSRPSRVNNDEDNDADDEDRLSSISGSGAGLRKEKMVTRKRRKISKTSKGVYLAPSLEEEKLDNPRHKPHALVMPAKHVTQSLSGVDAVDTIATSGTRSVSDEEETVSEKLSKMQLEYHRRVTEGEGRKTIAEELDFRGRQEYKFTEADLDPTIIELQVLEKGQYFGLSPLLFPDQPSLSVVSNGAECVVISKKFFLRLASEKCLRHLRQTESPYPSDQALRLKLQEVVDWHSERASLYRGLESDVLNRQAKRRQCLPHFQGQYCFRTGPV